ncbi:MAG: hypothetical protein LBD37_00395 [Treponema sp.]|jgi:hypothetical protein|nr:hypothetical protein [Treponema sp.]
MKVIYKITYPNGKIYVGRDSSESFMTYFGSGDEEYIQRDFKPEEMQDFTVRKEVIWSSEDATPEELSKKEIELIVSEGANNPAKGYNLFPKFAG